MLSFVAIIATVASVGLIITSTVLMFLAAKVERIKSATESLQELSRLAAEVKQNVTMRTDRGSAAPQSVVADLGDASKAFLDGFATFAKSLSGLSMAVQMYLFAFLYLIVGLAAASVDAYTKLKP